MNKGFAAMTKERHKEVSRMGGLKISENLEHMREIGRKGGLKCQANKKNDACVRNNYSNFA